MEATAEGGQAKPGSANVTGLKPVVVYLKQKPFFPGKGKMNSQNIRVDHKEKVTSNYG